MKYRSKPVVVEAVEWGGVNFEEVKDFMGVDKLELEYTEGGTKIVIHTPEGDVTAPLGHFIIPGLMGEFYPCMPEVFHAKYEAILEDQP